MKISPEMVAPMRSRLAEVEAALADPGTAAQPKRFRALMSEHAQLQDLMRRADRYFKLQSDLRHAQSMAREEGDPELRAMAAAEAAELEAGLPAAEKSVLRALLPPDPADAAGIIMEIRAGTGGEEAALFAADLHRMYTRYAGSQGWKTELLDASPSEMGGYKEIVFSVEGAGVYSRLRYESGAHRVQRVPATEQQGRIHTSAATVAVLPDAEEIEEIEIKPEDLRMETFRAGGAGGQHVNKTESAVRIIHLPTGLVVQCQDERSQGNNRRKAMRVLKARLLDARRTADAAKMADTRRSQIGTGDRSERIRTYNFPQNRLTDHRIELTLYKLDRIMEGGDLNEVIEALADYDLNQRLQAAFKQGA